MLSSRCEFKIMLLQLIAFAACLPNLSDGLIITSVLAGDKKFKTISFDHKWIKPLTFEKEMPNTEFRRHRTVRPPKFDIDVNIPIKLPLEDEYQQEEYKKPVESNIFFQTGEIHEPNYGYGGKTSGGGGQQSKHTYGDEYAAASDNRAQASRTIDFNMKDGLKGLLPALARSIKFKPQIELGHRESSGGALQSNARSDFRDALQPAASSIINQQQQMVAPPPLVPMIGQESSAQIQQRNYAPPMQQARANYGNNNYQDPEFIPGGFVNLQLSGPTGGPKMTYEDYDKERWAQQLSQTAGAMPYPILNYHQLQNFYGGLGTFTNGLAEHRYVETGLLDKFKSGLNHLTSKFHFG